MRVFKEFNATGKDVCPICGTKDIKETVLIPVVGTRDGWNYEAKQVHLDCLDLFLYPKDKIIAQKYGEKKK